MPKPPIAMSTVVNVIFWFFIGIFISDAVEGIQILLALSSKMPPSSHNTRRLA